MKIKLVAAFIPVFLNQVQFTDENFELKKKLKTVIPFFFFLFTLIVYLNQFGVCTAAGLRFMVATASGNRLNCNQPFCY